MSKTFVSVQPIKNGMILIEAQNNKEVVTLVSRNERVILKLLKIHFKLWMLNMINSFADAFITTDNITRIKQEK